MISDVILQYEAALQRLIDNMPERVPAGTKITNDSVALEAGRKKGSIKKKRFDELIPKIKAAAAKQKKENTVKPNKGAEKLFKDLYHDSLARELMLISQIDELQKDLSALSNVTNIATQKEKNRKAAEK
ncbi:hypothetical protein [Pseudomonas putida]|uniref:Uncharacterized protein n=1 Tax=Pseudomonas putida TaxID=303 RepID=A0A2S3WBR6_PSEPU|nr:hypothetical protein [Pseudomonas putida]POF88370.1 hypothetical protein BGP80_10510 [Pseudomonas putida]